MLTKNRHSLDPIEIRKSTRFSGIGPHSLCSTRSIETDVAGSARNKIQENVRQNLGESSREETLHVSVRTRFRDVIDVVDRGVRCLTFACKTDKFCAYGEALSTE